MALTGNLISYWKLDEASGNAADAHGSNTLTDNNTVTNATGLVYGTARSFAAASSEYLSITDNASLSTGNIDFSGHVCVYPTATPSDYAGIMGKGDASGSAGDNEWALYLYSDGVVYFEISSGSALTYVGTTVLTLNAWSLISFWHDATANQIGIRVNNGSDETASFSAGSWDSGFPFRIGYVYGGSRFWQGRIGPAVFWKRVLTSGERTSLYNSGNGLTYAAYSAGGANPKGPLSNPFMGPLGGPIG